MAAKTITAQDFGLFLHQQKDGSYTRGGRETSLPKRSSSARLLRHLLIGAFAAPQRWQEMKSPYSSSRRRFMSAHVNVSVIHRRLQLLRRSLMRSGASGRCVTTYSCVSAPSSRLRLGFSRKTVRASECVVASWSSTSGTTW